MMGGTVGGGVAGPIARLFGEGTASGADEGELLRRSAGGRDPAALEALVARHGPMVLGVCRRVLGDRHSTEDAFQATFLVLAKKAGSIRDPDRLGPWLHGVAHRVAVRSRVSHARRDARERNGIGVAALASASTTEGKADDDRAELRAALDEEVRRLPGKFRDPIVLCYLDGLTHDEAAVRLRCPVGTVRSRLSAARAKLRDRLTRRGVATPSGLFAAGLAGESAPGVVVVVSPALVASTVKAAVSFAGGSQMAAGTVPAGMVYLAEGVVKAMIVSKLKFIGGAALVGMLGLGVGGVAAQQAGGVGRAAKVEAPAADPPASLEEQLIRAKAEVIRLKAALELKDLELQEAKAQGQAASLRGGAAPSVDAAPNRPGGGIANAEGFMEGAGRAAGGSGRGQKIPAANTGATIRGSAPGLGGGMGGGPGGMGGGMGGGPGGMAMMGGGGGMGGMMAGSMAGMAGMGGGSQPKSIASIQSDDYVIVHKPKTDKVAAYSTATGGWTTYAVPEGTDVVPVASGGVVALMGVGDEIGQIATFLPNQGKWYPIDLKEPAHGKATPVVGPTQAVYTIGRRVYAFSALAGRWGVLELPEGAKPTPAIYSNRTSVENGDHIYIFSSKTGLWSDLDANSGQAGTLEAK